MSSFYCQFCPLYILITLSFAHSSLTLLLRAFNECLQQEHLLPGLFFALCEILLASLAFFTKFRLSRSVLFLTPLPLFNQLFLMVLSIFQEGM